MNIETEPLLTHLHNQGRLRVWSLIITFFGDSILAKGGEVEASRIKALMQAMNIEAGTLRTALSRLTNDNWLERYKIGKSTIYRLSDKGLKEFGPASELIYSAPNPNVETKWRVVINPRSENDNSGFLLHPGVSILPITEKPPKNSLVFDGTINRLSDEVCYQLLPNGYVDEINQLIELFLQIEFKNLNALQAMITRTLLIHNWRKIVLKFPEVPKELTPKKWKGYNVRLTIKTIYEDLTPLAENWLNMSIEKSLINFSAFETFVAEKRPFFYLYSKLRFVKNRQKDH